jgi:hypothetical protein
VARHPDLEFAPQFVLKPKTEPTDRAASPPISPKPCAPPQAALASSPFASAASARCRTPREYPSHRPQATSIGTSSRSQLDLEPSSCPSPRPTDGSRGLTADLVEAVLAATDRAGELTLRERGVG